MTTQTNSQTIPKLRFVCLQGVNPPVWTTFAWQLKGKTPLIRWEKRLGSSAPEQRCREVSFNFQYAYNKGSLKVLTNSYIKNQPVICTARDYGETCETLIMTLRPNEDGRKLVNDLKDNLNGYIVGPDKHTNQVFIQIDLEELMRNTPVETENKH